MVSFDNLEKAFAAKTDSDLRNDYYLFIIIGRQWLVNAAPPFVKLAINLHLPIKGIIRATVFRHFCGGEDINDCSETVKKLFEYKVGSILDYSAEGEEKEENFDLTANEIIANIRNAKNNPAIPFCVFKPTGIARQDLLAKMSSGAELTNSERKESERIYLRFKNICHEAHENNVRIFIDAEETWLQKAIDGLATGMMQQYNKERPIVFNTIQLYRTDGMQLVRAAYDHAKENNYFSGLKLVRGAYMEKERERALKMNYPSPIHPGKKSCDEEYDAALRFCIDRIDRISICAGTHNEASSMLLVKLMEEKNIPASHPHIYFSQLLGMSDHISYNLAEAGYNVAKYVPYGPVVSVLPYLIRRAQENTSISGQMGRELSLVIEERKRRSRLRHSGK